MDIGEWAPAAMYPLALPAHDAHIAAYGVDHEGRALLLTANRADYAKATAKKKAKRGLSAKARTKPSLTFSVSVQTGARAETRTLPPLEPSFHHIDRFRDGASLLVGSRSAWRGKDDFDLNGALIERGAGVANRIHLGDGIEGVAIDGADRIWVSYFDEGVFGNYGWTSIGPTGLGAGGLNCFDRAGALLWQHNRALSSNHIDDCYAMNVSAFGVWIYYYHDFKLAQVRDDFSVQYFETPLAGSHGLVTDGARFVFTSQYKEAATALHAAVLHQDGLAIRGTLTLALPEDVDAGEIRLIARGDILHAFTQTHWIVYALAGLDFA
ncbi:MAG: hypothetical protein AAGG54_10920 [Pseudomonadota bacterium]